MELQWEESVVGWNIILECQLGGRNYNGGVSGIWRNLQCEVSCSWRELQWGVTGSWRELNGKCQVVRWNFNGEYQVG